MNKQESIKAFYSAAGLLAEPLWQTLGGMDDRVRVCCEELRLRVDRPLELICGTARSVPDPTRVIRPEDLQDTLARCTGGSVHTYLPQLCQGFATARGGHRFGICGSVVYSGEKITAIRDVSSMNIRIARQVPGIGKPVLQQITWAGSIMVLSDPGVGKTTLLRDLARELSMIYRVSILDSRYELAGVTEGRPTFRIGNCDVLSGAQPVEGLEMLTRTMSPQYIVLDEITGSRELEALQRASFTGVMYAASCHAGGLEELARRPLYRSMMADGLFSILCRITRQGDRRCYEIWEEEQDELAGCCAADAVRICGRCFIKKGTVLSDPVFNEQR